MLINPSTAPERKQEMEAKAARCRAYLKERDAAGLLLTEVSNVAWLTGGADTHVFFAISNSVAPTLVTQDTVYLCCDNIETPRLYEEEIASLGIERADGDWFDSAQLEKSITRASGGGVVISDADPGVQKFLMEEQLVLSDAEIARYRLLGTEAARCVHETAHALERGWTEYQTAGDLAKRCLDSEIWPALILVASDERVEKHRHPLPTGKPVERCAMIVLCARKWGLIANLTRIVHFGPIPEALRKKHDAVMRVDATFNLASTPGASYGEVFRQAQACYAETGFDDEWKNHHQGGATGYQGRHFKATPDTEIKIEKRHPIAWNPSIAGTKSEDTILVTSNGPEVLTVGPGWPMQDAPACGTTMPRCDILAR